MRDEEEQHPPPSPPTHFEINGEEQQQQHPQPSKNTTADDQQSLDGEERQHPPYHHNLNASSSDGEFEPRGGKNKKPLTTKKFTAKSKTRTTGQKNIRRALEDSYANCTAEDKANLVNDITPTTSYADTLRPTSRMSHEDAYGNETDPRNWSRIPSTGMGDVYESNKARSITLWAPIDVTPATVIEAIQSRISGSVEGLVLGVERDTRVRSTAKINIITTTDEAAQYLQHNGIRIGTKVLYPRPTRPRPLPTRRGYLPNFPVAATKAHLEQAAGDKSVNIQKITPRLHKNTTIKTGGWTIWTDLDSPTPSTLHFDGEEYAVIWRGKRTNTNTTNNNTNETTPGPDPPIATRRPDVATEANTEPTVSNPTDEGEGDGDEGMTKVDSKGAKKRRRKKLEKKNGNANANNNNNNNRKTTTKDTANRDAAIEEEEFQETDAVEQMHLGKSDALFFNFPRGTGSASIKTFLKTREVKWSECRFFKEQYRGGEKRAVVVTLASPREALEAVYLCEERKYKYIDDKIYATGAHGGGTDKKFKVIYEICHS